MSDVVAIRGQGIETAAEDVVEFAQAVHAHVDEGDLGAKAQSDFGRVGADHASADDGDIRWRYAGYAAKQNSTAAALFLKICRAHLDAHATGDFAHRREQRQVFWRSRTVS